MQFGTATGVGARYDGSMAIERNHQEEQQARLEAMMAEFRRARQRHLEKQGIDRSNRTLTRSRAAEPELPPAKLN